MATLESIEEQIDALNDKVDEKFDEIEEKIESVLDKFESQIMHTVCSRCQGSGEISFSVEGGPGPPYTCPQCSGNGTVKIGHMSTTDEGYSYE